MCTMWAVVTVVVVAFISQGSCDCGSCIPHRPLSGQNHIVTYTDFVQEDEYLVYPSEADSNDEFLFFESFNFDDAPTGAFFIGAKNKLYEMSDTTFQPTKTFSWDAATVAESNCRTSAIDPNIACENYIRLYKTLPFTGADDRLLVCGTGAYNVTCRTIDRMDISDESSYSAATDTLDIGIISLHPMIPFAGDFLDDPTLGYQTTGYTESASLNTFDFARYNVSYDSATMEVNFVSKPTRTIQTTNNFHIKGPYLPVKLIKQDFKDGDDEFKMFYFFIRERKYYPQVSDAVPVRARIIRVCQEDNGLDIQANNLFFKTYIKLEMLCFGDPLNTPRAVGAQEHYYTVLRDIVQTDTESRWNGNTLVWYKLVYGVFTGDVYGPNGTAICVYHARFSTNDILDPDNRGIVDVFNFNKFRDEQGDTESANTLLSCNTANSRDVAKADHIIAVDSIKPYRGLRLPLVEMEGEVMTKIVREQVCVKRHNESTCLMQDVLIVGTNKGKIKKIVFTTIEDITNGELNGITHDAIVAQEWELADENSIEQLLLKDDYLYVATYTRIYKFPIADCSRHMSCSDCVGSRDPHCYYDTDDGFCKMNFKGSAGMESSISLDSNFRQNIHTGQDIMCGVYPSCSLSIKATAGDTIEVSGLDSCNNTNSFSVTIEPYDECKGEEIQHTITESNSSVQDDRIQGRRLYKVIVIATGDAGMSNYSETVFTPDGVPSVPTEREFSSRGINESHVEVIVSLEGCNIHDELENHRICVQFNDSSLNSDTICQTYAGVNSFVSGSYQGSESISYIITVTNDRGTATTGPTPFTVTTSASAPNTPVNLVASNITVNSISLNWEEGDSGFNEVTGYSLAVNGVKRTDCSTQDTKYTLYGLYSYTNYNLSVMACSEGGESDPLDVSTMTMCDRPSRIRNLYVTDHDSSSLTFGWDPPMYLNGSDLKYNVIEQCYNKSSLMIEEFMDTTSATSYLMLDLQPLTRCCVGISPVTTCNGQEFRGEAELLCNMTMDDIPGPVEQLSLYSPNPDSLFVTWSVPNNYSNPSLRYDVKWKSTHSSMDSDMVIDQLYYFIDGLNQSTVYTVTVTAISDVGYGNGRSISAETLPDVPTAPSNVEISFEGCNMDVQWTHDDKSDYNVKSYNVKAHCNRQSYTESTSSMSHTFNVCSGDLKAVAVAWCIAQVQAENDVGLGEYSGFVESVFPSGTPSTPECFLTENLGNMVIISFTITAPYALDRLTVNYTLIPMPENVLLSNRSFNGDNQVYLAALDRNQTYTFTLKLCDNGDDCSPPCEIPIVPDMVAPRPPVNLRTEQALDNEFTISWDHPENENLASLQYLIHVTGSNQSFNFTTNRSVNNYTVQNVLADTYYYYTIRSKVFGTGLIGRYSESNAVLTAVGIPPKPSISNVEKVNDTIKLSWSLPQPLNGSVLGYMIALTLTSNCNVRNLYNITDPSSRFWKLTLTGISDYEFVCIRSVNMKHMSDWVFEEISVSDVRPTLQQAESSTDGVQDIGILAAVVFLAICAIVAAIILVIILACVVFKHKSNIAEEAPQINNHQTNGQEGLDGETGWSNSRTPPKRIESTRSTTSRTVFLKNTENGEKACCKVA